MRDQALITSTYDLYVWDYTPGHTGRGGVGQKYSMVRQAHFVEIEVDPDTGGIEIKKQVSVNDGGKVINPDAFNGQQYGGAYMGLGRSSKETVYHDPKTGVVLNDNLIGYPVNVMNDVGSINAEEFWTVKIPRSTVLENDEIVREIQVPAPASGVKSAYVKFALRSSIDFPIVN
jgi:hypothetical protein